MDVPAPEKRPHPFPTFWVLLGPSDWVVPTHSAEGEWIFFIQSTNSNVNLF